MAIAVAVLVTALLLAAAFLKLLDYVNGLERAEADPVGPVRLSRAERRAWAALGRRLRRAVERDRRLRSGTADHDPADRPRP
jgi:hypothetical protein